MTEPAPRLKTRLANVLRSAFAGGPLEAPLASLARRGEASSWIRRLVPGHHLFKEPSVRRVRLDGLEYRLDVSTYEGWMLYYGCFDSPLDALLSLVRPGGTALDVGCNIGATILPIARAAGPQGRVYGFEPDPESRGNCAANIALNAGGSAGLAPIELVPVALGHETGTLPFSRDRRNPAGNRITRAVGTGTTVRISTLDSFVEEKGLTRVDLIKIDVEGFECGVLKGASATLRRFRPDLFIEVIDEHLKAAGASAEELRALLAAFGYRLTAAGSLDVIARPEGRGS